MMVRSCKITGTSSEISECRNLTGDLLKTCYACHTKRNHTSSLADRLFFQYLWSMLTHLCKLKERNHFKLVLPYTTSLKHTVRSHGWVSLAPWSWDDEQCKLTKIEQIDDYSAATVSVTQISSDHLMVQVSGDYLGLEEEATLKRVVSRWLSADWDPTPFTKLASRIDSRVGRFVEEGGGRFLRGSTFYEDFAKTILTINTNWASTKRMVMGVINISTDGAFPTPVKVLEKGEEYLRSELRLGFRAKVLYDNTAVMLNRKLIDEKGHRTDNRCSYEQLLELRGIGPYSASHMMVLEHDFSNIAIDSEVESYCSAQLSITRAEIPTFFQEWGPYAYLGYKIGRILRNTNPLN